MKKNDIYSYIFFLMTLVVGLWGCEKNNLEEVTTLDVARTFSTPGLTATVVNKTDVKLSWNAVPNAKTYTIEVFDNVDFSGTAFKAIKEITSSQLPYTITGLAGDTQYFIRVKA